MPVGVGDVVLVTLKGTMFNQTIMNTFHYGMSAVTGAPTQVAVGTEITSALQAPGKLVDKFLGACPPSYTLDEMWVQFILDTRYVKQTFLIGSPGTYTSDAKAANQAAVITRQGAAANRYNRGSIHIPYPSLDPSASGGNVSAAYFIALTQIEPHLYNASVLATLGTIQPILIHGTSKLNAIPLVSATSQSTVRTMRRRTVGRGI